jgi:uncharacterized membrane protein YdjX (TVP38/TMEM64 family)
VRASETLAHAGHRLRAIDDGIPDRPEISAYIEGVADPERPIGAEDLVSTMFGGHVPRRQASTVVKVILAGVVLLALALLWEFTPLAEMADPKAVRATLAAISEGPWGPFAVLGVFIAGGLLMFPVTVLIAATAATFGPLLGFTYAAVGALASALITYGLGARLGRESLRDVLGPRLNRIRERITKRGVIAVATVRLVPVAPFTLVNLVAGASEIKFTDFLLGTMIGMAPGLLVLSALGHQVSRVLTEPTRLEVALLVGAIVLWVAVSIGVQALVSKLWSAKS